MTDSYGRPLARMRKARGRYGMRVPATINRRTGCVVHHSDDDVRDIMLASMVEQGFDEVDAILAIEAGEICHDWTDTGEPVTYVYAQHRDLPDPMQRDKKERQSKVRR